MVQNVFNQQNISSFCSGENINYFAELVHIYKGESLGKSYAFSVSRVVK